MFESLHMLWYRIRSRFVRDRLDRDLAEELRTHAAFLEEEARATGASPDEARRLAAGRLGNRTNIHEATREHWSFGWMEALLQDTRYAFRFLRRSPGFTLIAVLSLALGIGANATVFTVVDRLLFSAPAHVVNPDGLHFINVKRASKPGGDAPFRVGATFAEYLALRDNAKTFAAVAVYSGPNRVRLGRGPEAPRIKESLVSTNFFHTVGVQPFKGRFLLPDDNAPDRSVHAAVISYAHWKRQYLGADSVIGTQYTAGKLRFEIVGIAPRQFGGLELDAADVWVALGAAAPDRVRPNWKESVGANARIIVRMRDGIAPATAAAEATVILRRLPERRQDVVEETVELGPIVQARGPSEKSTGVQISTRLALASLLVLLAACANLANLLLVRALTRRREIALRLAIGVSRLRLASQLLLESLIIALAGSLLALVMARWSGGALRSLVFPELQWATDTVDLRVFGFATLCGLVVAIVVTIAPALRMTRADIAMALRSAAPQLTASTGRLRQTLMTVQVALSVLLIVGASAFTRSLNEAYRFDMGVDVNQLITTRVFVETDSLTPLLRLAMMEESARRMRRVAGVDRVAISGSLPLTGSTVMSIQNPQHSNGMLLTLLWDMTPEMLQLAGFRLVRGRAFDRKDVADGVLPPILISETTARKLFTNADPIGRCARLVADTSPCLPILGVIGDLRQHSLRDEAGAAVLRGVASPELSTLGTYVVARIRPGVNPNSVVPAIRLALRDVRPDVSALEVQPLAEALEGDYRPLRVGATTIGSFALLTVILAAIGLYGILSFSVTQRTSEFGIRSALGAGAGALVASVVREGMIVVAAGAVLGMAVSWYASTAIAALLFQSSARDAQPYIYATVVLGLVALVASAVPAWRATQVDPAIALRAE